jgi:hypothetical protein
VDQGEKDNEHTKYFASLINSVATTVVATGAVVPSINYVYNILPATLEGWQINLMALSCVLSGLFIHLIGHIVLGGLK